MTIPPAVWILEFGGRYLKRTSSAFLHLSIGHHFHHDSAGATDKYTQNNSHFSPNLLFQVSHCSGTDNVGKYPTQLEGHLPWALQHHSVWPSCGGDLGSSLHGQPGHDSQVQAGEGGVQLSGNFVLFRIVNAEIIWKKSKTLNIVSNICWHIFNIDSSLVSF